MSNFLQQKKALLEKVYETAKNSTVLSSLSGISKHIDYALLDDYNFSLSYRTLETYYKSLVVKNQDCNIKKETLNKLSEYLGYSDFNDFCEKQGFTRDILDNNQIENNSTLKEILRTLVSIKEVVTYALSHFTIKQSSWGIIGLLVAVGFLMSKSDYTQKSENEGRKIGFVSESLPKDESLNKTPVTSTIIYVPQSERIKNSEKIFISERKKECMFWKNDHYEEVFCDEKIEGANVIALNEERLKLFRKIKSPDTLTAENAMGKIWYDKSDKKVEFFTYYGIHPTNGKTLKPVTPYILETYVQK